MTPDEFDFRVQRQHQMLGTDNGDGSQCVALSPDSRHALTCSNNFPLRLWDLVSLRCEREFSGQFPSCVKYASDGRHIVAGYVNGHVRVFDASSGREVRSRNAHGAAVGFVAFLSGDDRVISAGLDRVVSVWEVATGSELHRMQGTGEFNSAALSVEGSMLLVHWGQAWESDLRFYNPGNGREAHRIGLHQIELAALTSVALSPGGEQAVLGDTNDVILLDVASSKVVRRMSPPGQTECVAFSDDGRLVLAGTGAEKPTLDEMDRDWDALYRELLKRPQAHKLHVWNAGSGQELARCVGHADSISAIAVSADGRLALSAGADGPARVWRLEMTGRDE